MPKKCEPYGEFLQQIPRFLRQNEPQNEQSPIEGAFLLGAALPDIQAPGPTSETTCSYKNSKAGMGILDGMGQE